MTKPKPKRRVVVNLPEKNAADSPQIIIHATQVIIRGGRIDRLITAAPVKTK